LDVVWKANSSVSSEANTYIFHELVVIRIKKIEISVPSLTYLFLMNKSLFNSLLLTFTSNLSLFVGKFFDLE
jgi:hypothetical protein